MKRLSVVLLAILVCLALPLMAQEKEIAKEEMPSMAPPEPLNDDWSKWIVGEWEGWSESDMGKAKDWMKVELGLNNQFLISKYKSQMTEMTPEQMQNMKEAMNMSDEEIEKMQSSGFKGLGIQTIDLSTGEIVGHWFDSWRNVSKGKGKLEGNKEIMEWSGSMGSGTRIMEKVGDNKFIVTEKWTMPDGSVMEGKSEMTRKKMMTKK